MSIHPFFYSCVVDDVEGHPYKTEILVRTLTDLGKVPAEHICVQCTQGVQSDIQERFRDLGCIVNVVEPFLDKKYCNKLRQLDLFLGQDHPGIEGVFLLDIDIAVASPLEVMDKNVIFGKIVDAPRPPLEVLERIFSAAGISKPPVVRCDWGAGDTFSSNFNGGVLYLPYGKIQTVRHRWVHWAEFLFSRTEFFDETQQQDHIDQISFAMALEETGLPYQHFKANDNFPCHVKREPATFDPDRPIRVLHYHWCLNRFGLIAPNVDTLSALDAVVEKVNRVIEAGTHLSFFYAFKETLAARAAAKIPAVKKLCFSEEFIEKVRFNGRKRRLILHAGTPKTGTSSLQLYLGANRKGLLEKGYWYPEPSATKMPKHQYLVPLLLQADAEKFSRRLEGVLAEMSDACHTIIFTTEGIYNHWWDFPERAKGFLRDLAELFDFELWVWFREPAEFLKSFYLQNLKNPTVRGKPCDAYGRDISFAEAMTVPWFFDHADYLGFLLECEALFGRGKIRHFTLRGDVVASFERALGTELGFKAITPQNESLSAPAVELVRAINRYTLPVKNKQKIVDLIYQIDSELPEDKQAFALTPSDKRKVEDLGVRQWRIVRRSELVFCVGFHKTGTRTLGQALTTLGYRMHYQTGVHDQDIAANVHRVIDDLPENFDAFIGNPWSVMWNRLYNNNPRARFILSERATRTWLRSVTRYFGEKTTPMREWIYGAGSPIGNENIYCATYEKHNREVKEFFKDREGQLLVFNVENGDGWEELCGFLNKPVPGKPFPHLNSTPVTL